MTALTGISAALYLAGRTTHLRRGTVSHRLAHRVDYLLIDPDAPARPAFLSRNRFNLISVQDRDHGGPPGKGEGAVWARAVLAARGAPEVTLSLLTQPRFLWFSFNPVSFWLARQQGKLVAVIAEVSNTFGQRHSYLCHLPGFAPITPAAEMTAQKVFHVSPFQDVAGAYRFRFDLTASRVDIRIAYGNDTEGVMTTLTGSLTPLATRHILAAALRRPFGPLRTLALIYWHAARLRLKGATYRRLPPAPETEIS